MKNKKIHKIIHWGLLLIIILYIFTGFGITNNRIIGPITFEILSKPQSQQLHTYLIYPLVIFLYLHIVITLNKRKEVE